MLRTITNLTYFINTELYLFVILYTVVLIGHVSCGSVVWGDRTTTIHMLIVSHVLLDMLYIFIWITLTPIHKVAITYTGLPWRNTQLVKKVIAYCEIQTVWTTRSLNFTYIEHIPDNITYSHIDFELNLADVFRCFFF